jgi:ribosomal protein L31
MYRWFVIVTLLLGTGALPAHAQFASNDPLTVTVTPASPRPYETVTVTPDSTLIDLASAKITVSVNGTVIENGGGVQSVPVTVAEPGGITTITVTAVAAGQTYTQKITLRPADVALVIEPVSSTHPFYLGAALAAPQGRVRVIAIPDLRTSANVRLAASTLVYTWKWGDKVLADQSGIGRSIFTAIAPVQYRDAQITCTVTSPDGSLIAEASTVIAPVDPIVRIYPDDALMGPNFNHALSGGYSMSADEEAFRGIGYFFGTPPSLAWSVNGQSVSSDQDVTVRTTGSGQGDANLSFTATNSDTHQEASLSLPVHFGAKKATNIFGF